MSFLDGIYRFLRSSGSIPADQKANEVADSGAAERIDVLKYLSTVHRGQFDIRQKLEWRVIFTALTFYIVIPVGVTTNNINLPTEWSRVLYIIFTVIILSFLWRIQKAHRTNKHAAEMAEDLMWESVGKNPDDIFQRSALRDSKDRSKYIFRRASLFFVYQVLMLLFFAVISFLAVTVWATKHDPASQNKAVTIEPSKTPISQ
jgi:hypothetical protein